MYLSDAAVLGDSMRRRNPYIYLEEDNIAGQHCGCLLGGAILAEGLGVSMGDNRMRAESRWPWLRDNSIEPVWFIINNGNKYEYIVTIGFFQVCSGKLTFEQLIQWIRSVEPKCAECCRFDCSCGQLEQAVHEAQQSIPGLTIQSI